MALEMVSLQENHETGVKFFMMIEDTDEISRVSMCEVLYRTVTVCQLGLWLQVVG